MKEEWKEKLQRSLADFEESVPEGLWNGIEEAMAKEGLAIGKDNEKQTKSKVIALRALAAAACLAGGMGIFLTLDSSDSDDSKTAINIIKTVSAEKKQHYVQKYNEEKHLLANAIITRNENNSTAEYAIKEDSPITASDEAEKPQQAATNETAEQNNEEKTAEQANEEKNERESSIVINRTTRSNSKESYEYAPHHYTTTKQIGEKNDGKFTASLYAANSIGKSNSPVGGTVLADAASTKMFALGSTENIPEDSYMKEYYVGNGNDEHVNHHQPIRAGLSVRYALTRRFGIETGITYSYLSTDITKGSEDNRHETSQKLHFIGIPVNVDYSVWKNKWLNVYVSAGGMVEKNIKANSTTDYILNGKKISTTENKQKMKELQWSADAALGLQLNVAKGIGIYAEPGIGYYFENGSSIKTAYSEKPFNFNLKFGLRYSFGLQ